jgi:hypothetical protein
MGKVYMQMGVFTTKNEPSAAIMFEMNLTEDGNINDQASVIRANAIRLLAEYQAKQTEGSLPPEEMNSEKMALAILDIYHKVSAKPLLLESVMVKRGENDVITIALRKDEK